MPVDDGPYCVCRSESVSISATDEGVAKVAALPGHEQGKI